MVERILDDSGLKEKVTFTLLDADYTVPPELQKPVIQLWGRQGKKRVEVHVEGFFPYFYVDSKVSEVQQIIKTESGLLEKWVRHIEPCTKRIYFGGKRKRIVKLTGTIPFQVPKVREIFERNRIDVFEADIPFVKRYLIDRNLRSLHDITITGDFQSETDIELVIRTKYDHVQLSSLNKTIYHPLILAFDIEVDEQGESFQELLNDKKRRITAISFAWGDAGSDNPEASALVLSKDSDTAEKSLLRKFIYQINQIAPDVLMSFNGTFFDIPYLQGRMTKYGLSLGSLALFKHSMNDIIKTNIPVEGYRLKGRAVIDLMPKAWHIHPISGKKNLDTIASMLLGESKVNHEKNLGELWRSSIKGSTIDAEQFYNYSITDSILTFRLAPELGVSNIIELCRLTGYLLPEGLLSTSRNIGEFELMRMLFTRDILIPSIPSPVELKKRNELKEKYPHLGGWVIDPEVDQALFVAIFDFRSLYPNIVREHNISGETLIPGSESEIPENRFLKSPRGAFADLMDIILKERYETLKSIQQSKQSELDSKERLQIRLLEKKQKSLKLMANSLCGAANYPRGRFYHHILSNSITGIARELLGERLQTWTDEFSKTREYSVEVRYGDTDSIFCEFISPSLSSTDFLPESPKEKREHGLTLLEGYIDEYLQYLGNHLPNVLELKLEDIALRIILKKGRKKAYAYTSLYTHKVIIRGFEAVRSDWSPLAKTAQRKLLEILLLDFTSERLIKARRFIIQTCRFILTTLSIEQLITELSIRGPLRRPPSKYKTLTPAVGAFLNYCSERNLDPEIHWKEWDGFPYIIAKSSRKSPQFTRAFHPDLFREGLKEVDRLHYIREILGASNRFGIQINENEAIEGRFVVPLPEFFD
jgi:DNA polymerase elongation subunit (family B)